MPAWALFGLAGLAMLVSRRADDVPDADTERTNDAVERARATFHTALSGTGPFAHLAANARLATIEAEVLAVLATAETDRGAQHMLARIQHDTGPSRVALSTLQELFAPTPVAALGLGPEGALQRAALVTVTAPPDTPWLDHRAGVHPVVVWGLLGDPGRDPELPVDTRELTAAGREAGDGADLVVATGSDAARRREHAAAALGGRSFVVVGLPDTDAAWAAVVREATLTGQGVIVELHDTLPPLGRRWIERTRHVSWGLSCVRDVPIAELPRRRWQAVHVPDLPVTDEEWMARLGDAPRAHRLSLDQLELVAQAHDAYDGDLDAAVRRLVSGRLEQVTRRVHPRYTWDDLVLAPERKASLRAIADRYRDSSRVYDQWGFRPSPSRGTVALFSGPSGTGKSMAAEVVAGAVHLDLFKLDLSAVVSKYIGETEKNLEQVFEAAGAGNLLLFFDEADALFGKRSEVSDARDRYANIEVSYLLQRLEMYDGLVILATNFERNIDEAFIRRIHTRLEFTRPGPDEREAIWASNLPGTAPVDGVDTAWLAKAFDLTGGQIRNAVVKAAFLAASAGTPLTMHSAVIGVAHELRKQGRLLKLSDFGEYADAVQEAQQHGLV